MTTTDFTQLECTIVILTYKIAIILLAAGLAVAIVIIFILGFRLKKMARLSPSRSELCQPHTSINCAPTPDKPESTPASRGSTRIRSTAMQPLIWQAKIPRIPHHHVDISASESGTQSDEIPVATTPSLRESRHGSLPKSSSRQSSIESSSSGSSLSSSAELELMQKSRWARRPEPLSLDLWPDFDSVGKYVTDAEAEGRDVTRRSLTPSFTMSTTPSEGRVDDAGKSESKSLTTLAEVYQAKSSDTARKTTTI
ncbi:unnamed protein product [Parascedosporium putredinis]|uniref:Uncharacterized protein n=1 Tax=Parascedosporium putredinis TaxID=1442378 RepID=A0A9P1HC51_9PEZI|nr:unnamed protein product [Parascedosporium putredinis]CAI8004383.1 unnamed protein product [Parascedosporium putredinis]